MMIRGGKEGEVEENKVATNSSTWLRFKDPRIVRVSRAFGGKDRHSKVCTIRGLRDRRVRLSVPTAIQLYDLQDRLGLNQPSKVVDWLLNAAKNEIDELPPLPIFPGNFNLNPHQQHSILSSNQEDQQKMDFSDWSTRGKAKIGVDRDLKQKQDHQGLVNSSINVSSSLVPLHQEDIQIVQNVQNFHHHHQILVSPTQPFFNSQDHHVIDPRFQMLTSNNNNPSSHFLTNPHLQSSSISPFHFSMSLPSHNASSSSKNQEFSSK